MSAGVLFVSKYPIKYQAGCGPGRPVYSNLFLVMHPKMDKDSVGSWVLPSSIAEVTPST